MTDDVERKVYLTVHKAKESVEELADHMGCSSSLLYRASSLTDEKVDFKLKWLIPLMDATKNYSILRHIAARLGFALVRIPRARRMRPEELANHQAILAEYLLNLACYVKGEIDAGQVHDQVDQALAAVAGAKKMVEADIPQGELPFNGEGR